MKLTVTKGNWKLHCESDNSFYLGGTEPPNDMDFKVIRTMNDVRAIRDLLNFVEKRLTNVADNET